MYIHVHIAHNAHEHAGVLEAENSRFLLHVVVLTQCMILRGEPERDVRYTHTSQELIQQAEANTHMVFTDAAHHALCRTNGCIQGQLKAVSLQQITHI